LPQLTMNIDQPPPQLDPPRRGNQFTIRAILFLTLLVTIAAAGFGGLVRAREDNLSTTFVMFVVVAPLALLLVMSLSQAVQGFLKTRRQRDDPRRRE
jgi:hypothetical protein